MRNITRQALFLILGVVLGAVSVFSFAETISASITYQYQQTFSSPVGNCTPSQAWASSPTGACNNACWSAGYTLQGPDANGVYSCKSGLSGAVYALNRQQVGYSCPSGQNWSLVGVNCTRPDCPAPQVRNADGTCPTGCSSTALASASALYDFGTDPNGRGPVVVCKSNCYASFTGSVTKTALVAGVRHYYAQGFYTFLGDGVACTPGVSGAVVSPVALNDVPASTCPSGQSPGTVNGVTKCYSSTGQPAAETVAASSVNTTYSKTTNADNTVTVTKTTTDTKTNTSTTSQTVYPNAAAVPSNLPVSESGVQTAQTGAGGMSEFCAVNPTASACVTVNPGTAAETGGLYTKDTSGKTFTSVVTAAKQTITSSAFYNATAGFFQVGTIAGSCSGLSTDVSLPWTVLHIDAGQYLCGTTADALYSLLAAAMLLLSLGVAFAIAIL